jgi:hypothetical protein
MSGSKCSRCGAPGADLFANDGAVVCDTCSVYDQLVASEVRLSQSSLGVTSTGNADHLVDASYAASRKRFIGAFVCFVIAGIFGAVGTNFIELGYVAAGVLGFLGVALIFDAFRLRSFAKTKAPEIQRRASSRPPAMNAP